MLTLCRACARLFSVMSEKEKHIDWMDEQDAARMREAKQHDFAGEVELEEVFEPMEDFGWAGDTCWTGE